MHSQAEVQDAKKRSSRQQRQCYLTGLDPIAKFARLLCQVDTVDVLNQVRRVDLRVVNSSNSDHNCLPDNCPQEAPVCLRIE